MSDVQASLLHPSAWLDDAGSVTPDRRPKPGLLERVVRAMMAARQRQAEHHIARYIERNGGRLTDAVERGIAGQALGLRREP